MYPILSIVRSLFLLFVFGCCLQATAQGSSRQQPKLVTFQSGDETLNGYLWVPKGDGPFRAVVWNYGHVQPLLKQGSPSKFNGLADYYLGMNYVLFVPDRTGGEIEVGAGKPGKRDPLSQGETDDIIAAVSWLRQQPFVDATRVAVSGMMSGAVQSMLAVERDATIRAVIVFSPASLTWSSSPEMQKSLERAVDSTPVTMFLIQPQNDADLGPSEVLGRKLARKGGVNRAKIYSPFTDPKSFAIAGVRVWGGDVRNFLELAMK